MNSNATQNAFHLIKGCDSFSDFVRKLDDLGTDAEFRKIKGDAFEQLTILFFKTDPLFSSMFVNIWHHSELPIAVRDYLELPHPEIGVDLIAEAKDGSYCAIQCKFHQNRNRNVSYEELSTFFSVTERTGTYEKLSHRIVCTSANSVSAHVEKVHTQKIGFVTGHDFLKLGISEFNRFRKRISGENTIPIPLEPRAHQVLAIKKCTEFFALEENKRGKIIHPCGSGKSLTGYWISQKLEAKKILITVPSLALVRQTLSAWTRESAANGVGLDWIAVCSDEDVKNSDDPSMRTTDIGIIVTTSTQEVVDFLTKAPSGIQVVITTYQSGERISEASKGLSFVFDLAIYDEAHKTVGHSSKKFAHLLYDENLLVKKRLFMTATERLFKGDSTEFLSMDDPNIYGPLIDVLSFKSALQQNPPILSDYKVVSVIIKKSDIEQLIEERKFVKADGVVASIEGDAAAIASMIALRKLTVNRNIKHTISFHSSIKRAKDFRELNVQMNDANETTRSFSSFHVSGQLSTGERAAEIERFLENEPSLITNARCLTEGVDIPAVDAVLFSDPKQSTIDIVQAAGRAMRLHSGKEFGYIIIPVVIDDISSENINDAFKQIINVISALGMNDDRIIEESKQLVASQPSKTSQYSGNILEFEPYNLSTNVNLTEFIANLDLKIWDRLSFAKSIVGESEFVIWMRDHANLSEKTIKNYSGAVRKISNDLVRLKLAYSSLEELMIIEDPQKLKQEYFAIPEYRELDIRGKNMYSAGFNKLIEFHKFKN